jgi:putative DNA primase/helicase
MTKTTKTKTLPTKLLYTAADAFNAVTPEDVIAPRVLTPGGLLVFSGTPKIYKSYLMLSWLMHMAAGKSFLGMTPPRPLKVVYFQADGDNTDYYVRERMERVKLDPTLMPQVHENLAVFVTPVEFDAKGIKVAQKSIRSHFGSQSVDVIAIDPLYNVLKYGEGVRRESALATFLESGVAKLRGTNPDAGVILVHQSDSMTQDDLERDAMQGLHDEAVLRRYCSSCVIMRQPEYDVDKYQLIFNISHGEEIATKDIELVDDQWREAGWHETDRRAKNRKAA